MVRVRIHPDAPLLPELWVDVHAAGPSGVTTMLRLPGLPEERRTFPWGQIDKVSMAPEEYRSLVGIPATEAAPKKKPTFAQELIAAAEIWAGH